VGTKQIKSKIMKKVLVLFGMVFLLSCDGISSKDKVISSVLESETRHLKRYNELQKISKDTAVVSYLSKLKDSLKLEAIESRGVLKSNSGIIYGSLENSQIMVEEYIKLCE